MKFLLSSLPSLPAKSGVYLFKDKKDAVLYAGKARDLARRVRSYFQRTSDLSPHKQMMVKKIADIETIITSGETEALILESVLIKKHKPPYNVVLKDDKNYQFVKIDYGSARPTVTTVRRPDIDRGRSQARYFGPYTSGSDLQEGLRLLRRIFPWRKKDKKLTIFEHDLLQKRTLGPLPQTDEDYREMIARLARVLEGKNDEVVDKLTKWMKTLALNKQFEQAAQVRDQITALKHIQAKQKVVSLRGESQDVIGLYRQDDLAAVNLFVIRSGKLVDKRNFILQHARDESDMVLLDAFLTQYYKDATNPPKELIIPVQSTITLKLLNRLTSQPINQLTIPHHGKKRELIKLGAENAREYLMRSLASWQNNRKEQTLLELKNALHLNKIPIRIEGYDISNISGQYAVGSMAVFTNGEPDKNQYRKFKIKTVKGADDFAMLAEVLKRRFGHNDWPQPDLVLLDGGKGQLGTVLHALFNRHPRNQFGAGSELDSHHELVSESGSRNKFGITRDVTLNLFQGQHDGVIPLQFISLAKKQEEIFQGPRLKKINLDPRSPASLLLQRVRDEAHRFAKAYYHLRHSKAIVTT